MFDKIKSLFRGRAPDATRYTTIPIGRGNTILVDAAGDVVYATCVEILAKQLAQIRWGLYGKNDEEIEGLTAQFNHALNVAPCPGINAYDFWAYMEKQRLTTGNAFAYLEYDLRGHLEHLIPLEGSRVTAYWDTNDLFGGERKLIYEYTEPITNATYVMLPEELLHVKAFSANGIVGRPAISILRETLQSNAEVEGALRSAVINGFQGTIVLSFTSDLSLSKQKELQKRVSALLKESQRTILPLPVGVNASHISNDIKSYYDTLKAANAQAISSLFGIPLVMLNIVGGTGMATFSGNQISQYYNLTVAPIVQAYASELTAKLLTRAQLNKGYAFDSACDAFDFLDPTSKASVICSYKSAGILSADEGRASLKYPRRGGEADELICSNASQGRLGDSAGNEGGGGKGGKQYGV